MWAYRGQSNPETEAEPLHVLGQHIYFNLLPTTLSFSRSYYYYCYIRRRRFLASLQICYTFYRLFVYALNYYKLRQYNS